MQIQRLIVLGIIVFTIAQAVGSILQSFEIFRAKKANSVSVSWFAYYVGLCLAQIDYGYWRDDEIILYNAYVLAICQIPILVGLWKYKTWFVRDWFVITISIVGVIITFSSPGKQVWFTIFGAIILVSANMQSLELWTSGRGQVDPRLLTIYLLSSLLWGFYAFWRRIPVLMWLNPAYSTITMVNITLWIYDRPQRLCRRT